MTAEIAILNRSAVALAADSAGTIGQGGSAKIYNGFNKIFELSEHEPIGIMIYGNLDYMGLPLEALIKRYRKRLGRKSFPHVKDYLKDFVKFLSLEVPANSNEQLKNEFNILYQYFGYIFRRVEEKIFSDIKSRGKYLESKINESIKTIVDAELIARKSEPTIKGFFSKLPKGASTAWQPLVESALGAHFSSYKLNKANRTALVTCGLLSLQKGPLSGTRTGIVVTGFGKDEYCPSLEAIEIDGMVFGRLKSVTLKQIDIDRGGPVAEMIGFAQDDMVSTFLNGVDPRYEQYVDESLGQLFAEIVEKATGASGGTAPTAPALTLVHGFFDHVRTQLATKLLEYRNKTFMTPIVEMIRFMPTQELATLAASMIEITSLKRRVTRDRETVGGEIDVAVISKAEGFVWIKRKHYFPPDLNPRFFKRLQREADGA
ncbi:hypothetical protein [Caulobacter sp. CCG-8]|uniref:hypothetical protein n=1 Tax=Caulobacter sp. CCG-8 TaxID=3127958 RepID=UPI00307F6FFE